MGVAAIVAVGAGLLWVNSKSVAELTREERIDLANQWFYLHEQGVPQEKVRLADGAYVRGEETIRIVGEPEYRFDVDGDGAKDVAAVLESTKEPRWQAVYLWTVTPESVTPVEWPASWQWTCAAENHEYSDGLTIWGLEKGPGIDVLRSAQNVCGADVGDVSETHAFIGMRDGIPILIRDEGLTRHATETCVGGEPWIRSSDTDFIDITESTTPLLQPRDGAPPVSGPDEDPKERYPDDQEPVRIRFLIDPASNPDPAYLEVHNGYVPAVVDWWSWGGCGWVPWDTVKPVIDAHTD
ncbi:hypothetical protein STSO111631_11325 [Stackebrandtia soli]